MQEDIRNISPIKQRILQYAGTLGISKRDFYIKIGVSRGTLESKTGITEDIMAKFIATYPEVSYEWLLSGEGEMLRQKKTETALSSSVIISKDTEISSFLLTFTAMLKDKDRLLAEQAEEIGSLKEQIRQLKRGKGDSASDVPDSTHANAG